MRPVLIAVRLLLAALSAALLAVAGVPATAGYAAALPAALPAAPAGLPAALPALPAALPALATGKKACTVADGRLDELSGIVATDDGYAVVNDSTTSANRKRVFFLNEKCRLVSEQGFRTDPRDPEDMTLSADGSTLWIADIGDNKAERSTVALWSMPVDGSAKATIRRLTYPDGAHDAEALLLSGKGIPYIITKTGGKSAIYAPATTAAKLPKNTTNGTPMTKLGEITLPKTGTENRFGSIGRLLITGGAVSPDGTKVVLRTYADAFEWDVPDGDVVKALTGGAVPRHTPLTSDPFGEAISYTRDGSAFVTVSDLGELGADTPNTIYSYAPGTATPTPPAEPNVAGAAKDDKPSWIADLSLTEIMILIGSVGLVGLILVVVGVVAIVRSRRRPPTDDAPVPNAPAKPHGPAQPDGTAAAGFALPVQESRATRGGVYNSAHSGGTEYGSRGRERAGTTYGSRSATPAAEEPAGPERSGGTYRSDGYQGADEGAEQPRRHPRPRDPHHDAGPARGRRGPDARRDGGWDQGGDSEAWEAGTGWDGGAGWDAPARWDAPAPSSPAPAPPPARPPAQRRGPDDRGGAVYGAHRPGPDHPPGYGNQYDHESDPHSRY